MLKSAGISSPQKHVFSSGTGSHQQLNRIPAGDVHFDHITISETLYLFCYVNTLDDFTAVLY